LLLGLIREGVGKAIKAINHLDVDTIRLKKSVEDIIKSGDNPAREITGNIPLTKQAENVLKLTYLRSQNTEK
jgi:ATP-dependent Clp protease ATP-binding subunit ClpC